MPLSFAYTPRQPEKEQSMPLWEYRRVTVQGEFASSGRGQPVSGQIAPSAILEDLRAEGWAVISTITIEGNTATLLLQRPETTP